METKYLMERLATKYESFYLYDEQSIITQINTLKKKFPSVDFLYSVKCNSNENILSSIFKNNFGAGVSSLAEIQAVKKYGLHPEKIFYSAPGKSMKDLQASYQQAVIIADSISEIERIKYLAKVLNEQIRIGIKINPNFTYENDGGVPSKFGIDEDDAVRYLATLDELYVKVVGMQANIKSQELDCSKINRYYKKVFQLAEKIELTIGHKLDFLNLGSGIGIPCSPDDRDVNVSWLGTEVEERITNFKITRPKLKIMITLGRFIVGKSGTYITHVIDKKTSHGKTYVILQNIVNGFFKPVFSEWMKKSEPQNRIDMEPFFTKVNSFEIHPLKPLDENETVTLVGNSCMPNDVIAEDIDMPKLRIGDVITISNAGSYSSVLTPMQFSSMGKVQEIFFTVDGEVRENPS